MTKQRGEADANRPGMQEAAEAFVRQSNEAVFGAGPGDFISKHTFLLRDLVTAVRAIRWFDHCGEPHEFELTMPVERIETWSQASKALKSQAWERARLEARNQLTAFLSKHHRTRFREWNKLTQTYKHEVVALLESEVWEPFRQSQGLNDEFVESNRWNIVAALMENAYSDCGHKCFFFQELLTVYEAGHVPCGWVGDWPRGNLVVY
jgi:hypothetical protein